MAHVEHHAATVPAAKESGTNVVLNARPCSPEQLQVSEAKRSPMSEVFKRACDACSPPVSQREIVRALRSHGLKCWPSQVARWQLWETPKNITELMAAIPRFGRAYAEVLAELAAPVPTGEDPTSAALDVSEKAGHLVGLVRSRARGPEVDRASQDVISATRRVRAACRGAA